VVLSLDAKLAIFQKKNPGLQKAAPGSPDYGAVAADFLGDSVPGQGRQTPVPPGGISNNPKTDPDLNAGQAARK